MTTISKLNGIVLETFRERIQAQTEEYESYYMQAEQRSSVSMQRRVLTRGMHEGDVRQTLVVAVDVGRDGSPHGARAQE